MAATALFAGAFPAPATVQQVPTIQAGAGGRYETQIDPKTEAYGFSTAQVSVFRPKMQAIVEIAFGHAGGQFASSADLPSLGDLAGECLTSRIARW